MQKKYVPNKKYTKISLKRRHKLIDMIIRDNTDIKKAAKVLRLNISTAKLILKKYQQTGGFFKKDMSRKTNRLKSKQQKEKQNYLPSSFHSPNQLSIEQAKEQEPIQLQVVQNALITRNIQKKPQAEGQSEGNNVYSMGYPLNVYYPFLPPLPFLHFYWQNS